MTNQAVFNKVARHLLTQKKKSRRRLRFNGEDSQMSCAYRGWAGMKCAIGCLIPDDRYSPELEGPALNFWDTDPHGTVMRAAGLQAHQLSLAARLQAVHDQYPPRAWAAQLGEVAVNFDLSPKVLEAHADRL